MPESDCTCLSRRELTSMMVAGRVMQSRPPCPVHGEPELPPGMLKAQPAPSGVSSGESKHTNTNKKEEA